MKDFHSPTHGELSIEEVGNYVKDFILHDPKSEYVISIGSDSQNKDHTKLVSVISVHRVGKGGIFFYQVFHRPTIRNVKEKIYYETSLSLDLSQKFTDTIHQLEDFSIEEYDVGVEVHVDIGTSKKGKTRELIKEIVGWVESSGFVCKIKPESYCSSAIANRITK